MRSFWGQHFPPMCQVSLVSESMVLNKIAVPQQFNQRGRFERQAELVAKALHLIRGCQANSVKLALLPDDQFLLNLTLCLCVRYCAVLHGAQI